MNVQRIYDVVNLKQYNNYACIQVLV